MELTQEQINKLKESGMDDAKISALAKQNGYTMPVAETKSLSANQVAQLRAKGLDDAKINTLAQQNGYSLPEEVGGVQAFAQAVAKPFLKVASSIGSIADIATAKTKKEADYEMKRPRDFGYFGQVAPLNTSNPLDAIGVGAEIGSYAIGGGGTAKTVAQGLKGQILKAAGKGFVGGATSGGTMSFGQALQEAEVKPSDVAYKTLFGTAVGGAVGLPLGAITPVVVKGAGVARRFTNLNEINTELNNLNTQVFKPTPKQLEKWSVQGKDPIKTYTEIFGTEVPQVGKDNRFTKESIMDAVEKVDSVYKPAAEGFNTILRNSPEVNSISKARDMAIKNLDAYDLTPSMYERAVAKIDGEFNAVKDKAIKDGVLLGDDSIPVYYTDNLKDKFWKATKNFGTEDATIANSVNSSIGHGFKDSIENSITDLNVKNYNKKLGDLIVLRDFLETKSGSLAGTGGKMTRLMARVAGTVAGSQFGTMGSIMGNLTGDKIAQIMINPAMQPYRWLINKKLKQLPQGEVLRLQQEANDVLQAMYAKRQESIARFALPEGAPLGTAKNPIVTPINYTPNQTGINNKSAVAVNAKEFGINQPLNMSDNIPPTTKPTISTKNNAITQSEINASNNAPKINTSNRIIDNSIPQKKGFIGRLVDKYKNSPLSNQGGYVSIGGKTFKQIPEATKKELIKISDYINLAKEVNDDMEFMVDKLFDKYNINPNWKKAKILDTIEKLVEGTKTS